MEPEVKSPMALFTDALKVQLKGVSGVPGCLNPLILMKSRHLSAVSAFLRNG